MTRNNKEFSEELYESGKSILECLDKDGFNYPIALWVDFPHKNEWTLLFGIPSLELIGPNDILGNMKRIIRENNLNISIDRISLIDAMDKFCINLKSAIKTGSGIGRIKLSSTQINDQIIPQTVIYRVN